MSDSIIVEDERTYNWTSDCNNCHKTVWWNYQVRHAKTRRCLPMNSEYHPGVLPSRHMCMKKGGLKAGGINKYENKVTTTTPVLDVDKVDARTKEIEVKRWRETVGYQPLDKYEREHLESSRKSREKFKI